MERWFVKKCFCLLTINLLIGVSCFAQEATINIQQNPKISQLLDLKLEMNENNAFGERYKIQIFYGTNGEANEVIQKFRSEYPDWPTTIEYQAPNYKVWVGDFRNRLEADRAFLEVKEEYESAFIFKPKGS